MNELDAAGLVLEVLSLVGTSLAAIALVAALVARLVDSTWLPTQAVIATDVPIPTAHWIAGNTVYSRELYDDELERYGRLEEAAGYYSRRSPDRLRFERMSGGQRALWLLFLVTAVVGVGSMIASVALGFFEN